MSAPLLSVRQLDFTPQQDVFPSPADWRDAFIYFLLVDRFDNNRRGQRAFSDAAARGRDSDQGGSFKAATSKAFSAG